MRWYRTQVVALILPRRVSRLWKAKAVQYCKLCIHRHIFELSTRGISQEYHHVTGLLLTKQYGRQRASRRPSTKCQHRLYGSQECRSPRDNRMDRPTRIPSCDIVAATWLRLECSYSYPWKRRRILFSHIRVRDQTRLKK